MKKIFKTSIFALVALLVFSCEEEDEIIIAQGMTAPSLKALEIPSELKESDATNEITLSWDSANYGVPTQVNYLVEMALSETDFAEPLTLTVTQETSYTWTIEDLNSQLIQLGIDANNEGSIDLRVKSSIGSERLEELTSPVSKITTTPYSVFFFLPNRLWLPGGYANASGYGNDWDPADEQTPTLAAPDEDSKDYEGYVYFANNNSQFKIIEGPEWNTYTDYGTNGTEGVLFDGDGENNLEVVTAGYYRINADLDALTYTLTPTTWAVTGDATPNGWASDDGTVPDHDMVYDPVAKTWSTTLDLVAGKIKFRANDEWTEIFGGADGILNMFNDTDNTIPVDSAGNYTITIDLSNPRIYTYSIVAN